MFIGAIIGVLIGGISGMVTLVVLYPMLSIGGYVPGGKTVPIATTHLLALPVFWFGGPWISTSLIGLVELNTFLTPYIVFLAFTYFGTISYPLVKWIRSLGLSVGRT
jgi:hypothetical protein